MNRNVLIVLGCVFALATGCATNKKKTAARPQSDITRSADASNKDAGEEAWMADASEAANPLAGAWNMAMPMKDQQPARIMAKDETHVTIRAGEILSGEYVVQGQYLLMLSNDARLRPIAWRINTQNSITVVRSADLGEGATDYTGVTLVRAPSRELVGVSAEEAVTN